MKGNKYSNYISTPCKELKYIRKCSLRKQFPTGYNSFNDICQDILNKARDEDNKSNDYYRTIDCAIILMLVYGYEINFYIEAAELITFLENTDIKHFQALEDSTIWNMHNEAILDLGIQTTCKINLWNRHKSIVFTILKPYKKYSNNKDIIILYCSDGKEAVHLELNNKHVKTYLKLKRKFQKLINLVFNLILYIECYPELIIKEAPMWFIKLNKNKKNITIKPNLELLKTEVCPHYRSGHFRRLDSDYFKTKKGQIIYIKSAFIKKDNQFTILDKPIL